MTRPADIDCTCELVREANYNDGPAEWLQDPFCEVHPDCVCDPDAPAPDHRCLIHRPHP